MILFWHFRYFSPTILSFSLSLSIFSPMLTNTSNLMHGFKLLFSNWTPNTCEEAYMSILSIRRHLTFLRLHTLCSKLLSCCCFYCHYDAYTSQLVIGSRSHHTSHSGEKYFKKYFAGFSIKLLVIYILRDFQNQKNTIETVLWKIYLIVFNNTLIGQWS